MRLSEARREHYRRMAHEKGFRSRAYFKLDQIDKRFQLIKQGQKIIDFGCAPGGWLQYASVAVGHNGLVVGVDLRPVKPVGWNVKTLVGEITQPAVSEHLAQALAGKADVVLSDMAPNVTGTWELDQYRQISLTAHVVSLMPTLLREGGSAVLKVFQGDAFEDFVRDLRKSFVSVTIVRPPATRSKSSEVYLVCKDFKPSQPS
ncbi:MAG: RlmE family RNA methyltransferase [Thaumarchaeota archaeon]|nr:RlmE family RNA methyltransferase [Nitrososphaerota archaeon]